MISENGTYMIAEVGINHNGDLDKALEMIRQAKQAGCDAVKFQKRTVEIVYTAEELARARENVFGPTNGDLKRGLEFGRAEYDAIDRTARDLQIDWFASPWDEPSVDFLMAYETPYIKIASAMVTDRQFLEYCAAAGRPLLVSTGMSDLGMIRRSVDIIEKAGGQIACLYHCTSTYPTLDEEINLLGIKTLQKAFPHLEIGFSGHEQGILPSICAATLGACSVERHVTLDRSDWGSDQKASLEMAEMAELVGKVRRFEVVRGDGVLRFYEDEKPIAEKLRRNDTLSAA
ncbi:MAG: N-acetylneuraminate synthase family protein [Roseibium album]|uniref:Spore coat polysaccharide biosynthesis protein SpsE n=1 Tax=Roseibium album TaxID=311410 RepID=A0A0M6ZGB7_9HYPH|nr:N-acetylneuraminate synthase family protein [Roseibium album]MBG6147619.1 N-acetylneuraminate synthase [Labrenzia sp. EL_142]MBG6155545.1 N-acetylneuraminate synthase [Labrenzia sp. EL_162]MBG6176024.1 N-acetylneuraminate synthase [Labrenzia sp. EL_132]MBG6194080.1 N-acetylneuraminate synthase [Labrenzia sp. EL_159]MBG6230639.1 N-acetylneuraminate synthase [Labrenzia sp. EL_208]MCR9059941.1 N-acetylneuraminate synthase family protein [Paracoccaceae bacterium]